MANIWELKKNLSGMKDRLKVHLSVPKRQSQKNKNKDGDRKNQKGKKNFYIPW